MPTIIVQREYGFDRNAKSTISLLESAHEDFRFVPDFDAAVRRTSSLDDISKFYRYFDLVRSNLNTYFTWQQYLKILQEQLNNFETLTLLGKAMLPFLHTHQEGQLPRVTNPPTQIIQTEKSFQDIDLNSSDAASSTQEKDPLATSTPQFDYACVCKTADDSVSITTKCSTTSLSNRSRVLLKICAETKSLAQKISKTADIISRLPQKCVECGTSLDEHQNKNFCVQGTDIGGDMAGKVEEFSKVDNPISTEVSDFQTIPLQVTTFTEKQPSGAGESTISPFSQTKESPDKKFSLKRLVKVCKQYVTRK